MSILDFKDIHLWIASIKGRRKKIQSGVGSWLGHNLFTTLISECENTELDP